MGGGVKTATYIKLDGFNVPGYFLHGSGEAKRDSVRVSNGTEKPFIFTKLNMSMCVVYPCLRPVVRKALKVLLLIVFCDTS